MSIEDILSTCGNCPHRNASHIHEFNNSHLKCLWCSCGHETECSCPWCVDKHLLTRAKALTEIGKVAHSLSLGAEACSKVCQDFQELRHASPMLKVMAEFLTDTGQEFQELSVRLEKAVETLARLEP